MSWFSSSFAVRIVEEGRSGKLRYSEGLFHSHEFHWEFGGGSAVVLISVPTATEWPKVVRWAADRRAEVLERIGSEVLRQRCPGCRVVEDDGWLTVYEAEKGVGR